MLTAPLDLRGLKGFSPSFFWQHPGFVLVSDLSLHSRRGVKKHGPVPLEFNIRYQNVNVKEYLFTAGEAVRLVDSTY